MENNLDFVITKTKRVLTKYKGSGGDVTIPAGVTEIGWRAFEGCTGLTSFFLEERSILRLYVLV